MSKTKPMDEKNRAERLVEDLDRRLQNQQAFTEQSAPEDRPLLDLAEQLSGQTALAVTPFERSQLRRNFEQLKTSHPVSPMFRPLSRFLKPTFQAVMWTVLLIGVFVVTIALVSNLIGKPTNPVAGPAPTGTILPQPKETSTPVPKPVSINLDQALALIQNPTWNTVFFEYQVSWHGENGKDYSFYKQVWMDQEKHGRVISSEQIEGTGPRTLEMKPDLLFISDGKSLKVLHLPSGQEQAGWDRAPWRVSPMENTGEGMADFFPSLNGIDQAGPLTLDPFEDEIAGRPAIVIRGKDTAYWYDRETGLLLRKDRSGENPGQLTVKTVVYNTALPTELNPTAGVEKATFVDTLPQASQEALPTRAPFSVQAQTVNGIRMELREVVSIGSSLRATLCYQPPSDSAWRLEAVELKVSNPDLVLPFYPSSSARPVAGSDGFACETFTVAHPGVSPVGDWTLSARRLVGPREAAPDCASVQAQIDQEVTGVKLRCDSDTRGYGFTYSVDEVPPGTSEASIRQLVNTYMEADVRYGPWVYSFAAESIPSVISAGAPVSPVVVPSSCDPDITRLEEGHQGTLLSHPNMSGVAGAGTAQSGDFSFKMGLACDPSFSRLMTGGDYYSEINGLGILWEATYQGQNIDGEVNHFSGVEPFVKLSGGTSSITKGSAMIEYKGLQFPENIRPDFTQADVRLRYLVKVRIPDGTIQGAALSFTLQRASEGYRPVDVRVDPLSDAERQTVESDPNAPLPYPTLPAPVNSVSSETQALLDLLERWQKPLLATPGWIHMRTRTEMPNGTDLYAGLKEYTNDDWFQIDAQAKVIAMIHIDQRMDGTMLQQTISQNGKTTNLTFGNTGEFQPYPLDLAFAVKGTLKAGDQVKRSDTTVNGKPVILLTLNGMFTRRDAINADSGAWLYTETLKLQAGDDPLTGGSLETRTTLVDAERVDAPPAEAFALLGNEFAGYTPPAPYGTPAPQGFDPSHSKLALHSVPGDSFNATTFWFGDISTSGDPSGSDYLLGRVDFGNTPSGFCDRSADGSKLAFNHLKTDPSSGLSSSSLRWFDLRSLDTIHQPAPELVNLGVLSWSTKLEKLAVFGCKADQKGCGLYLLDPAIDQIQLLLPDVYSSWQPIWNPDGSQIAFVNTLGQNDTMYIVNIQTGQVAYQGKFDASVWQVPADSPTNAWGVTFPRGVNGSRCFEVK